jgi:4-diphosphocytidyl-2-C-methyl-D-erythritol kinase
MTPPASIDRFVVRAPAKINLCLHIGAKRPDGYHDLQSLVTFADFGDELIFERNSSLSLSIGGPFADSLTGEGENLILKAARRLRQERGSSDGAKITLIKHIPVASGVGGGSSDAAAALRGLNRLWNLTSATAELQRIGAEIGSDVPVCVEPAAAWMEGRGERVRFLPALPRLSTLLVNPRVHLSTADVFRRLDDRSGTNLNAPVTPFADVAALVEYLETTSNDLEAPAVALTPVIGELLDEMKRLPGVRFARMSGSGATCYAIMKDAESSDAGFRDLRNRYPHWWTVATFLGGSNLSPKS